MRSPFSLRSHRARRALVPLLSACLLTGAAAAQVPISGSIADGSGGPLLSGVVYHATASLTVDAGTTLTIQPGAIVKFTTISSSFVVNGTLDVQGTAANPAILTTILDDSAGGDTGADGPTVGVPERWRSVIFNTASDASTVDFLEVRFGGQGGFSAIDLNTAGVDLTGCTVRDCGADALDLSAVTTELTVTDCEFRDNGGTAVDNVPVQAVPRFLNNSASGNGGGDYMRVTVGTLATDLVIEPANILNGALVLPVSVTVPTGLTLTLQPGVVFKWAIISNSLVVNGTLLASGTAGSPIVLTSFADDSVAGDTNGDGASAGIAGGWRSVVMNAGSDGSVLDNVEVRFGGQGGFSAIDLNTVAVTLTDCTVRDCGSDALDLSATTTASTITGCSFDDNGGFAVDNVPIQAVPQFLNNDASGNAGGDYMRVTVGTPTTDITIAPPNVLNGVLVLTPSLVIPAGRTLTLDPGVVFKMTLISQSVVVNGTLLAEATDSQPVVFTSFADDAFGGDTNGDGPSAGLPSSWRSIVFNAGSEASVLTNVHARFGGQGGFSAIDLNTGGVELTLCRITSCGSDGIDLSGIVTDASIIGCTVEDGLGLAVNNVPLEGVPSLLNNSASGNALGDYMRVTVGTLSGSVVIGRENVLNGALVLAVSITVPDGTTLRLNPGVVLKTTTIAQSIVVNGVLNLRGTAFDPVVLTCLEDDAYAGDTNLDGGASVPVAGRWRSLQYNAGAGISLAENVLIRYSGQGGFPSLKLSSPLVTARSVRVEHGASDGILADEHAGGGHNWVAFDCAGDGIDLAGGAFDVVHATSTANGSMGIRKGATHLGQVVNTISFANGTANYEGFSAGDLLFSDGSPDLAGIDGNTNADPLFTDPSPSVGDLTLLPGSPCLNAGDPGAAMAVVKDHDENSRLLDHDLSGAMLPDVGAYERPVWTMDVVGEPVLGTTLTFTVSGPPGLSIYFLGFLDGTLLISPYGFLTAGLFSAVELGTVPVGTPFPVPVPDVPSLVGLNVGIQTGTIPLSSVLVGNATNLYRGILSR